MTSKKHIMEVTPSIFVHSNILILTLANVCYVFPTKLEKMLIMIFLISTAKPLDALQVLLTKGHKNQVCVLTAMCDTVPKRYKTD